MTDFRTTSELLDECRSCGCSLSEEGEEGITVELETGGGEVTYPVLCEVCADEFYRNQREHSQPDGGPA